MLTAADFPATVQGNSGEYRGIFQSLTKMWREEGFRGQSSPTFEISFRSQMLI